MGSDLRVVLAVLLGLAATFLFIIPALRRRRAAAKPARSELYRQVVEALLSRDFQEALGLLREIALGRTEDWNAQLLLGDLLRVRGQGEKALRIHQMLATRSSASPQARGRILESVARDHLAMGRPSQALSAAQQSLGEDSNQGRSWEVVWRAQDEMDDKESALDALRSYYKRPPHAAEGVPSLARYTAYLGQRALEGADHKAARKYLQAALRLDPGLEVAKVFLGDLHISEDKPEEAIDLWKEFARRRPEEAGVVFGRLEKALFQLGRFGDLHAVYEDILDENPGHPAALAGLARMYLRRGLHDEAESCLTILLEKEPGHSQGRRLLLGSLLSSGKVDEARSLMEGWLEKDEPRPSVCPACGHRDRDLSLRCVRCGAWQPAEPPRSR